MASHPTAEPQDQFRATKRKLDDAFLELDNSVITHEDDPRPPKRSNTSRSIYSTLAKYGVSTRSTAPPSVTAPAGLTKPTPHLSAILARATTRTKSLFSFRSDKQAASSNSTFSSNAEYRPSSVASFLSRLATFKLATYANKPPQIDAVAASKCGWINDGKDRLVCGICGASWVVAGRDGMSREAANVLVEKQRLSLVEAHKQGCPWKLRQCDPSIYRIPLQSPAAAVRGIKVTAMSLNEPLQEVTTKHPLTQTQVNTIKSTIISYSIPASSEEAVGQQLTMEPPSETAILAALFGWSLVPPTTGPETRKSSFSRSGTPVPGTPARTPSLSRAATPTRGTPVKFNIPTTGILNKRDTLLQCVLCQRRIGLWTFLARPTTITKSGSDANPDSPIPSTPQKTVQQRQFDLLREHRSYCPYVVRSTAIPALPVPASGSSNSGQFNIPQTNQESVMEGWRAVLTVILRYGLGQKQTPDHDIFAPQGDTSKDSTEAMEVDGVKAMVAGVKSRGGKDLMKYVKGLLG
ncbi:zf-C3HC-domain-containing protein [Macrolepiota fuliginosa MF-IS2]|uniref:Zf-C3HC-domain-containing protein n=1 Tax=Macrolepiota fuliginosa MF-IS2 TaxID=1400762 RepID=A0A9P6C1C7_9AGAR|nr:zf-C3HC-domain-containing protein [Macrolepiota fuliginosa MF-IS2]